jgi:hypothetical protein
MRLRQAGWKGEILGALLAGALSILTGCGGGSVTGPDEAAGGRTALGISVNGAGAESFASIDESWRQVTSCWAAAVDPRGVRVEVREPETRDRAGDEVIRFDGRLCYGARQGNVVYVATDLRALRHEFSHLVGEAATGGPVENAGGRCWL